MKLLGTAIHRGEPAERALLISDLHVPSDGGEVAARLAAAIECAQHRRAALFVLGDLFDSYVCRGQVRVGVWRDVAQLFAQAARKQLRIVVLPGNRDFLMGQEFVDASQVELVPGGYRAELGGVDTLMVHGDELCQNDLPYQRVKRWLRHPLTRGLARRLPVALARVAAERARKRSQNVIQSGDQTRFLPSARAIEAAFATTGVARLVFGHIHRHASGEHGGGQYFVLPAFDATGIGLFVDAQGWRSLRLQPGGKGTEVAAPAACPWSA